MESYTCTSSSILHVMLLRKRLCINLFVHDLKGAWRALVIIRSHPISCQYIPFSLGYSYTKAQKLILESEHILLPLMTGQARYGGCAGH